MFRFSLKAFLVPRWLKTWPAGFLGAKKDQRLRQEHPEFCVLLKVLL